MSLPSSPCTASDTLTDRQRACLELAAAGLTSRAIGAALGISSRTADEHLAAACAALGVRTRVQAAAALALGGGAAGHRRPPVGRRRVSPPHGSPLFSSGPEETRGERP